MQRPGTQSKDAVICGGTLIHQILKTYFWLVYNYSICLGLHVYSETTLLKITDHDLKGQPHKSPVNLWPPAPPPPLPRKVYCYQHIEQCTSPVLHQQTQDVESMLGKRWSTAYDARPTFTQHWFNVLCMLCDPQHRWYRWLAATRQATECTHR